jgi:hypothetical protein
MQIDVDGYNANDKDKLPIQLFLGSTDDVAERRAA